MVADELVEGPVQLTPGHGEGAALGNVGGQAVVEPGQPRREDAAVGLGEQDGHTSAERGEPVAVGMGQALDEPFASEAAEVVGGLA